MAVKETIIIDGDASGYVKEAEKASKEPKASRMRLRNQLPYLARLAM